MPGTPHCFVVKNLLVTSLQRWFFGILIVTLLVAYSGDKLKQDKIPASTSAHTSSYLPKGSTLTSSQPSSPQKVDNAVIPSQVSINNTSQTIPASSDMGQLPAPLANIEETDKSPTSIPPSRDPSYRASIKVDSTEYVAAHISTTAHNHTFKVELFDHRHTTLATLTMELDRFSNECNLSNLRFYSVRIDPRIMGFPADTDIEFARSMSSLNNHDVATLECIRNDESLLELNVTGKGIVQRNNGNSLPVFWDVEIVKMPRPASTSRIVKMSELLHS